MLDLYKDNELIYYINTKLKDNKYIGLVNPIDKNYKKLF